MSIDQMRAVLIKRYPGPKWSTRVSAMSNEQVFATYTRMLNAKQL